MVKTPSIQVSDNCASSIRSSFLLEQLDCQHATGKRSQLEKEDVWKEAFLKRVAVNEEAAHPAAARCQAANVSMTTARHTDIIMNFHDPSCDIIRMRVREEKAHFEHLHSSAWWPVCQIPTRWAAWHSSAAVGAPLYQCPQPSIVFKSTWVTSAVIKITVSHHGETAESLHVNTAPCCCWEKHTRHSWMQTLQLHTKHQLSCLIKSIL